MHAEHPETGVGAERPAEVRLRAADAGELVPAVGERQIRLDADPGRRHAHGEAATRGETDQARVAVGRPGPGRPDLEVQGDGQKTAADDAEPRVAADRG